MLFCPASRFEQGCMIELQAIAVYRPNLLSRTQPGTVSRHIQAGSSVSTQTMRSVKPAADLSLVQARD